MLWCAAFWDERLFAQTSTPTFTPAPTVVDVLSFGTASSALVWVDDPNVVNPISLSQYIGGVLKGELDRGDPHPLRQNAYTAVAIAAISKWNAYYHDPKNWSSDPTPVIKPVSITTSFQVFDDTYKKNDDTVIDNAVETAGTHVLYYDGSYFREPVYSSSMVSVLLHHLANPATLP